LFTTDATNNRIHSYYLPDVAKTSSILLSNTPAGVCTNWNNLNSTFNVYVTSAATANVEYYTFSSGDPNSQSFNIGASSPINTFVKIGH